MGASGFFLGDFRLNRLFLFFPESFFSKNKIPKIYMAFWRANARFQDFLCRLGINSTAQHLGFR
jgi:hypothetical protein